MSSLFNTYLFGGGKQTSSEERYYEKYEATKKTDDTNPIYISAKFLLSTLYAVKYWEKNTQQDINQKITTLYNFARWIIVSMSPKAKEFPLAVEHFAIALGSNDYYRKTLKKMEAIAFRKVNPERVAAFKQKRVNAMEATLDFLLEYGAFPGRYPLTHFFVDYVVLICFLSPEMYQKVYEQLVAKLSQSADRDTLTHFAEDLNETRIRDQIDLLRPEGRRKKPKGKIKVSDD